MRVAVIQNRNTTASCRRHRVQLLEHRTRTTFPRYLVFELGHDRMATTLTDPMLLDQKTARSQAYGSTEHHFDKS